MSFHFGPNRNENGKKMKNDEIENEIEQKKRSRIVMYIAESMLVLLAILLIMPTLLS